MLTGEQKKTDLKDLEAFVRIEVMKEKESGGIY
jgi:hypothetical protein